MPEREESALGALQSTLEALFIPWPGRRCFPDIAVMHDGQEIDTLWISVGQRATLILISHKTDLGLKQEGADRKTVLGPKLVRFCQQYRERMLAPHTRMERSALLALVERGDRAALSALLGLRPTNSELDAAAAAFADEETRGRVLSALSPDPDGMEILLWWTDSQALLAVARAREREWSDYPGAVEHLRDASPWRAALAARVAARQKGNLKELVAQLPLSEGLLKETLLELLRRSELSDSLLLDLCLCDGPNAEECLVLGAERLTCWNRLERLKQSRSAALRKKAARAEERIYAYIEERAKRTRAQVRASEQDVLLFLQGVADALGDLEARAQPVENAIREQVPQPPAHFDASPWSTWEIWQGRRELPIPLTSQVETLCAALRDFSQEWCGRWFAIEQRYPDALLKAGRGLRSALYLNGWPDRLPACRQAVAQFRLDYPALLQAASVEVPGAASTAAKET